MGLEYSVRGVGFAGEAEPVRSMQSADIVEEASGLVAFETSFDLEALSNGGKDMGSDKFEGMPTIVKGYAIHNDVVGNFFRAVTFEH